MAHPHRWNPRLQLRHRGSHLRPLQLLLRDPDQRHQLHQRPVLDPGWIRRHRPRLPADRRHPRAFVARPPRHWPPAPPLDFVASCSMLKPALPEALSHQGEGFFRLLTNPIIFGGVCFLIWDSVSGRGEREDFEARPTAHCGLKGEIIQHKRAGYGSGRLGRGRSYPIDNTRQAAIPLALYVYCWSLTKSSRIGGAMNHLSRDPPLTSTAYHPAHQSSGVETFIQTRL